MADTKDATAKAADPTQTTKGGKTQLQQYQERTSMMFLIFVVAVYVALSALTYAYVSQLKGCRRCDCSDNDSNIELRKVVNDMINLSYIEFFGSLILIAIIISSTYYITLTSVRFLTGVVILYSIIILPFDIVLHKKNNNSEIKILKEKLQLTYSYQSKLSNLIWARLLLTLGLILYFIWTNTAYVKAKGGQIYQKLKK